MSAQHTPGPWTYEPLGNGKIGIRADGAVVAGYVTIVDIGWPHTDQRDEQQANARLMAAAPDLLAALKAVVAIADRKTVEFYAARAAIARATGAQP